LVTGAQFASKYGLVFARIPSQFLNITKFAGKSAMIVKHFTRILYVTGFITMLPIAMFFLPWVTANAVGISLGKEAGVAFAKHWGLMAFCFGGLLMYAAQNVPLRRPIVIAAAIEKIGLCVIIAMGWNDPTLSSLRATLFIDGAIVWVYGIWLLSGASSSITTSRAM
jgi:hypothetical protein